MYQFSGRLKMIAIILMLLGIIGIAIGFFTNGEHHDDATHDTEVVAKDGHDHADDVKTHDVSHEAAADDQHTADHAEHSDHAAHLLANRPWSAVYIALFFFFMIALSIFVFYASQVAASAGWSVALYRVMEGLSGAIVPIGLLLLVFLVLGVLGVHHLFPWMTAVGDEIIEAKSFWLNIPGWTIRAFIFILGYIGFRHVIIKRSEAQDKAEGYNPHEKGFRWTILFVAFFMLTEAMFSWDWIMSLDPHWFSTLFAWYIFASGMVSAVTVIAIVTIYLKFKGYLKFVNQSHIHDLGKFMFGFSIFWTYLWFAQFMLIWYAHMPEETVYFVPRMYGAFKFWYFFMLLLNFLLPVLILMDRDWKRKNFLIIIVGIIVLAGHYIDFYMMIMPSTIGDTFKFGIPEIGGILFFLGLFIYFGFSNLAKRPLLHEGSPYIKETLHHHF